MTIQKKYILFFASFMFLIVGTLSCISISFLKEIYDRLVHAANTTYLPVMASHMFFKATLTFAIITIVVVGLSIPLGIFLSQWLSAPYLRIFKNLRDIAQKRKSIDDRLVGGDNERSLLESYIMVLVDDLQTIKEYEKGKAWKEGARLLMHELKNPLTPLKLSAQELSLDPLLQGNKSSEDVKRILVSIGDIERIMFMFRELVNVEFGKMVVVDINEFVTMLENQVRNSDLLCPIKTAFELQSNFVRTEPVLLRMLAMNLIRNGKEQNSEGFHVDITQKEKQIKIDFITPGAHIAEPNRLFRPGYSSKGNNRGYGLFLCKMISDYLGLVLTFSNTEQGVCFSIVMGSIDGKEN